MKKLWLLTTILALTQACGLTEYTHDDEEVVWPFFAPRGKVLDHGLLENTSQDIHLFADDLEYDSYLEAASLSFSKNTKYDQTDQALGTVTDSAMPESSTDSAPSNEGITNNQETGADEGGIVKNIGDYLITLRHGKLSATSIKKEQNLTQTDSLYVAADASLKTGVWYDEILVKGNIIIVTAYRYALPGISVTSPVGATEVSLFSLNDDGKISRGAVYFYESDDYFSGSNYSTRLVDGNLVLYTPVSIWSYSDSRHRAKTPHIYRLDQTNFKAKVKRRLAKGDRIYRPLRSFNPYTRLNVMHKCPITSIDDLSCESSGVLGDFYGTRYATANNLYMHSGNTIYQWSLDTLDLRQHAIFGYSLDRFSFKEKGGALYVAVSNYNETESTLSIVKIKTDDFTFHRVKKSKEELQSRAQVLGDFALTKIRFNNNYALLLGSDTTPTGSNYQNTYLYDIQNDSIKKVAYDPQSRISRLELMGEDKFLAVGSQDSSLTFEVVDPITRSMTTSLKIDESYETESRSHGFFFKPRENGGVFGIAQSSYREDARGSQQSGIGFYDLNTKDDQITELGTASSRIIGDDECLSSCVDWYGNTRPIFLKDRVFALMGDEIIEMNTTSDESWTMIPSR